ncbi:MAG: glycosyltransferase family protein [Synergistaceae bacterium]|jgi:spore coat polysaccharide biosynthesis protein SpsF|nr:glycosyltransferase family protein [Synergistaceae bacterium]
MRVDGKNKKVAAVIQARMTSTRLPGKVMLTVLGKPLLGYELERVARSKRLSKILVATTVNDDDDVVARYVESLGFGVWRGPEDDVLERYHAAALAVGADIVVRLTADCPLIDPALVDQVVAALLESEGLDYVSNTFRRRTYPRGLDTEAFTFAALDRAWREGRLPPEREHVTPYIYNHPEIFKLGGVRNKVDLSRHRWTVDTPEDFALIKAILEGVYPSNPNFSFKNIVDFMNDNPRLFEVNCFVKQKT